MNKTPMQIQFCKTLDEIKEIVDIEKNKKNDYINDESEEMK